LHQSKTLPIGTGKAAVSPEPVELCAAIAHFAGTDDDFMFNFFVPDNEVAGGLRAARPLVEPLD
jgi:hypothetical protein